MSGQISCSVYMSSRPWQNHATTHGHILYANEVEHVLVVLLELRQIDVLLDVLVLRPQLGHAAHDMHRARQNGRGQAVRWLCRRCTRKVRIEGVEVVQDYVHRKEVGEAPISSGLRNGRLFVDEIKASENAGDALGMPKNGRTLGQNLQLLKSPIR